MAERPQNPFSLYDFLGYFVPGALFLYGVDCARSRSDLVKLALSPLPDFNSEPKAEFYIPFVLCAYVIGHFLSVVSSYTIERYSIWRYGYPSKYLLRMRPGTYWKIDPRDKQKTHRLLLRVAVPILMLPVWLLDVLLGKELYAKGLDPLLQSFIMQRLDQLIVREGQYSAVADSPDKYDQDWFRFIYHHSLEKAPTHVPKMQNYVALYGFCRTATLLGLIFFWLVFSGQFSVVHGAGSFCICFSPTLLRTFWLLVISLGTFGMFVGFNKFYRRFSLEAFMAFIVCYPLNQSAPGDPDTEPPTNPSAY